MIALNLSKEQIDKIIAHFGAEFYQKVLNDIEKYSIDWGLRDFKFIEYYSVNCIFKCYSDKYGNCVLKIGNPCREIMTEYNTLCEYEGRRFCKVYNADIENGALLIECISPGTQLRAETDIDKRLAIFFDLFNRLHIKAKNDTYPTYLDWVNRITQYMKGRCRYKYLTFHMEMAQRICMLLCEKYTGQMLLHGDLHHDNILLSDNNGYIIIDPKGVIGDPVFDIPRYLLNEFFDNELNEVFYNKITHIISGMSKKLGIPDDDVRNLLYVEMCMANCWNIESGEEPLIENVEFAYKLTTEKYIKK